MAQLESLADAPGSQREYETIFILAPDTPNEGVGQVNDRIKGVVEGMGGKVLKVDNWGKRRLAYEVKKHPRGIYLYWQYLGTAGLVHEIERNLRMLDSVIRYMTVRIDENIDPNARPSEMDDEAYARAAATAADEEDLMTGAVSRGDESEESDESGDETGSDDSDDDDDGDRGGDDDGDRGDEDSED